jgi:SAM-dependent methyltransferase
MKRSTAWWILAGAFAANALRLRGHAARLRLLDAGGDPEEEPGEPTGWVWVTAAGVEVPGEVRRAAERQAAAAGLQGLDLVPRDLACEQALVLAGGEDPARYRDKLLASPLSALQAILVEGATWERMKLGTGTEGLDPVAMHRVARELKRHAPDTTDVVVVAGMRAATERPATRRALLRARVGPLAPVVLWFPLVRLAVLAGGILLAPLAGLAAAAAWCLQPLLALLGTPLEPSDLARRSALRWLLAAGDLTAAITSRWTSPSGEPASDPEAQRATYDALLAGGTERFFEPRRPDCPLCGGGDLCTEVRSVDLLQRKPGRFVLERCGGCGHVFQNPRLSPAGLDFYYRDAYEGIGAEMAELVFVAMEGAYRSRAEMLDGGAAPRRWIDVGTGHAHFCLIAGRRWPEAELDGLDMSDGVEAAARRGWVAHGYRGYLVDLAPQLAGHYDVVSMFHYLEHTREPLAELDAAISLLAPGGQLLVELPDPECRWGRLLGQYWMPWFQPQHQHLMPLPQLESALLARGLEVVRTDGGRADLPANLTVALLLLAVRLVPPPGLPWRRRSGAADRAAFVLAVLVTAPLLPLAFLLDRLAQLVVGRRWRSNAYRVLARRPAAG